MMSLDVAQYNTIFDMTPDDIVLVASEDLQEVTWAQRRYSVPDGVLQRHI